MLHFVLLLTTSGYYFKQLIRKYFSLDGFYGIYIFLFLIVSFLIVSSILCVVIVGNVPVSHELDKCVPPLVFTYFLSF